MDQGRDSTLRARYLAVARELLALEEACTTAEVLAQRYGERSTGYRLAAEVVGRRFARLMSLAVPFAELLRREAGRPLLSPARRARLAAHSLLTTLGPGTGCCWACGLAPAPAPTLCACGAPICVCGACSAPSERAPDCPEQLRRLTPRLYALLREGYGLAQRLSPRSPATQPDR